MQNQTLQQNDAVIIGRHIKITGAIGIALMIAYAVFENATDFTFTPTFEEMRTRALALMVLPILIGLTLDCRRIGRLFGDPD